MARRSPHSRAIVRLAKMLIEQGRDLCENGRRLSLMLDADEGRMRELAGGVVSDVGHCILLDARSTVMRRQIASIEHRVRALLRTADPDRKPCGATGCTGYLHLGDGPCGSGYTWCPALQVDHNMEKNDADQ